MKVILPHKDIDDIGAICTADEEDKKTLAKVTELDLSHNNITSCLRAFDLHGAGGVGGRRGLMTKSAVPNEDDDANLIPEEEEEKATKNGVLVNVNSVFFPLISLARLILHHNKLTPDLRGCEAIARTLTYLDVSKNNLTSLNGLQMCTQLAYLDASHNSLTSLDGLPQLAAEVGGASLINESKVNKNTSKKHSHHIGNYNNKQVDGATHHHHLSSLDTSTIVPVNMSSVAPSIVLDDDDDDDDDDEGHSVMKRRTARKYTGELGDTAGKSGVLVSSSSPPVDKAAQLQPPQSSGKGDGPKGAAEGNPLLPRRPYLTLKLNNNRLAGGRPLRILRERIANAAIEINMSYNLFESLTVVAETFGDMDAFGGLEILDVSSNPCVINNSDVASENGYVTGEGIKKEGNASLMSGAGVGVRGTSEKRKQLEDSVAYAQRFLAESCGQVKVLKVFHSAVPHVTLRSQQDKVADKERRKGGEGENHENRVREHRVRSTSGERVHLSSSKRTVTPPPAQMPLAHANSMINSKKEGTTNEILTVGEKGMAGLKGSVHDSHRSLLGAKGGSGYGGYADNADLRSKIKEKTDAAAADAGYRVLSTSVLAEYRERYRNNRSNSSSSNQQPMPPPSPSTTMKMTVGDEKKYEDHGSPSSARGKNSSATYAGMKATAGVKSDGSDAAAVRVSPRSAAKSPSPPTILPSTTTSTSTTTSCIPAMLRNEKEIILLRRELIHKSKVISESLATIRSQRKEMEDMRAEMADLRRQLRQRTAEAECAREMARQAEVARQTMSVRAGLSSVDVTDTRDSGEVLSSTARARSLSRIENKEEVEAEKAKRGEEGVYRKRHKEVGQQQQPAQEEEPMPSVTTDRSSASRRAASGGKRGQEERQPTYSNYHDEQQEAATPRQEHEQEIISKNDDGDDVLFTTHPSMLFSAMAKHRTYIRSLRNTSYVDNFGNRRPRSKRRSLSESAADHHPHPHHREQEGGDNDGRKIKQRGASGERIEHTDKNEGGKRVRSSSSSFISSSSLALPTGVVTAAHPHLPHGRRYPHAHRTYTFAEEEVVEALDPALALKHNIDHLNITDDVMRMYGRLHSKRGAAPDVLLLQSHQSVAASAASGSAARHAARSQNTRLYSSRVGGPRRETEDADENKEKEEDLQRRRALAKMMENPRRPNKYALNGEYDEYDDNEDGKEERRLQLLEEALEARARELSRIITTTSSSTHNNHNNNQHYLPLHDDQHFPEGHRDDADEGKEFHSNGGGGGGGRGEYNGVESRTENSMSKGRSEGKRRGRVVGRESQQHHAHPQSRGSSASSSILIPESKRSYSVENEEERRRGDRISQTVGEKNKAEQKHKAQYEANNLRANTTATTAGTNTLDDDDTTMRHHQNKRSLLLVGEDDPHTEEERHHQVLARNTVAGNVAPSFSSPNDYNDGRRHWHGTRRSPRSPSYDRAVNDDIDDTHHHHHAYNDEDEEFGEEYGRRGETWDMRRDYFTQRDVENDHGENKEEYASSTYDDDYDDDNENHRSVYESGIRLQDTTSPPRHNNEHNVKDNHYGNERSHSNSCSDSDDYTPQQNNSIDHSNKIDHIDLVRREDSERRRSRINKSSNERADHDGYESYRQEQYNRQLGKVTEDRASRDGEEKEERGGEGAANSEYFNSLRPNRRRESPPTQTHLEMTNTNGLSLLREVSSSAPRPPPLLRGGGDAGGEKGQPSSYINRSSPPAHSSSVARLSHSPVGSGIAGHGVGKYIASSQHTRAPSSVSPSAPHPSAQTLAAYRGASSSSADQLYSPGAASIDSDIPVSQYVQRKLQAGTAQRRVQGF